VGEKPFPRVSKKPLAVFHSYEKPFRVLTFSGSKYVFIS
jgi:hypothetical protein